MGVGAHFDRQAGFGDEVAGAGADGTGADDAAVFAEDEFGVAVGGVEADGAAVGGPGEGALGVFDALGLGLVFGDAGPGDFANPQEQTTVIANSITPRHVDALLPSRNRPATPSRTSHSYRSTWPAGQRYRHSKPAFPEQSH